MHLDSWIRLIVFLLPPVFVFFLKNKKLFIASLIMGLDMIYSSVYGLFDNCFYCGFYDATINMVFTYINLFLGIIALAILLKRKGWFFVRYHEPPSKILAWKKTKRFYGFVLFLIFVIVWLTIFFGNSFHDLSYYVVPFILFDPLFFDSLKNAEYILGLITHMLIAFLYYLVCLSEIKTKKLYTILLILFYFLVIFLYFIMILLMMDGI